jgi:solute:Na+ symporter, SSS family
VGIGVLAQPQLVVRFMTVKSRRELNRAVAIGGVFILAMTGVAFTVGALSNVYFTQQGPLLTGRVVKDLQPGSSYVVLQLMRKNDAGTWLDVVEEKAADGRTVVKTDAVMPRRSSSGEWLPVVTVTNAGGTMVEGKKAPVMLDGKEPLLAEVPGQPRVAQGRSIAIVYAKGNDAQIIPMYITSAMPKWFGLLFLLTLLSAAMSTLSSQFHTLGTAAGRDVFERLFGAGGGPERTIPIVRMAILLGLILAVTVGYYARGETIIARATAIFFGLCASTFLPTFLGGLFWQRMTKAGALASMITGFAVTAFWLAFVKVPEVAAIGLVKTSILAGYPNWPVVDPLVVALPFSVAAAVTVSWFTRPPDSQHLQRCFPRTP